MGLFNNKNTGGIMDIIRCDEQEYLVHKWSPSGVANTTKRENSIRYGSKLRVKEGELAVFVYKQKDGTVQDYLMGPFDATIKTGNFPVLSSIVGLAFDGNSPFQAEIYFINLSGNIQLKFGVPYFDIYDVRFSDLGIPCTVRGTLTFNLTDYLNFIKLNRLIDFNLDDFKKQIKDFLNRKIKSVVLSIPSDDKIQVMQMERKIDDISAILKSKLTSELSEDFGINLKRIDIGTIELDKTHPHYQQLKKATADQQTKFVEAQTDISITNLEELMRIQRKDTELQVEGKNFTVHQLNQQTDVLRAAAESMGQMGNLGNGGGLNPAGLMTGLAMGGIVGNQMGGMMNKISQVPPSAPPSLLYHIALNGQQGGGPHSLEQLKELAKNGQFTSAHHVWSEGMANWDLASNVQTLQAVFANTPPPPPIA